MFVSEREREYDRYECDNTQSSKVLIYYNIIITSCIVPKY